MQRLPLNRRKFMTLGGAALAAPMISRTTAWAQGKQLYVISYIGTVGNFVTEKVVPEFQKRYGCSVFNKLNNSLQNIATLRGERSNPQTSVVMMDDFIIPLAKQEGLIQALPQDKIPNLAKLHNGYLFDDSYGAGLIISKVAPWYNMNALSPPPTSWGDLWDKRLRGRFLMVTPKFTQSVMLLAMTAALKTGKPVTEAQYEMLDVGDKLAALKPNVEAIQENVGGAVLQVLQGQADIGGPDFSKNINPYIVKGAPIAMMEPKEGSFSGVNAITLVNNAPEPELGAAFIDYMLSPEVQKGLAETALAAPATRDVKLRAEVAEIASASPDDLAKLLVLDWKWINPRRNKIIDLFNQTFG